MVGQQSLDLLIGVRIPVSQPVTVISSRWSERTSGRCFLTTDHRLLTTAHMEGWHETEVRVRYAETDQMGIAHHSNYLIWFEAGRSDFCRDRGFSYKDMEEREGALLVVAESYVRYKSPAFYEDVLLVRVRIGEIRSRSLRFVYEIVRRSDEALIAEGETLHLVTDEQKKVRTLPEAYRDLLLKDSQARANAFPANQAPS